LGDPGADGTVILKLILRKDDIRIWTGFIWRWVEPVAGSSERINGTSCSIEVGKVLETLVTVNFSRNVS
jgi:hypothetical protein